MCRLSLGGFASEREVGKKLNVGALLVLSLARETDASLADISMAIAGIQDPSAAPFETWGIFAFHVDGVDGDALQAAFLVPYTEFGTDDLRPVTVNGQQLIRMVSRTLPRDVWTVVWTDGDVLYNAFGVGSRANLREILRAVPAAWYQPAWHSPPVHESVLPWHAPGYG